MSSSKTPYSNLYAGDQSIHHNGTCSEMGFFFNDFSFYTILILQIQVGAIFFLQQQQ